MKKLVLFVAMLSAFSAKSQSTATTGNIKNTTTYNHNLLEGYFEVNVLKAGVINHYGVSYTLSPVPFSNVMTVQMATPHPMSLSGKIVDASGTTLINWNPGDIGYRYKSNIDITSLNSGNYNFQVYDDAKNLVKTISFVKP